MAQSYKLFTSCLWQTTSAVVSTEQRLYLFDPAYFPHEIEAIADYVQSERNGRELILVLTHGDWDHVVGVGKFPDATVIAQKEILTAGRIEKKLNKAKRFDGSYYVVRSYEVGMPTFAKLVEDAQDWQEVYFLPVPGHTPDQMATLFREQKLLVVGDMLSNLEFPFIDDSSAYLESLEKIEQLVLQGEVEEVIPGHGVPAKGREEILHRIERDRQYLLDARAVVFEAIANNVEEDVLREQFSQLTFDGVSIDEHLRSSHDQNRDQLYKEAISQKG
ncbi:MBL fold metallo-hydrolase [Brevibacillus porteri]|uniref:Hydrolase glyoxylase n=1 Tax=Brevibacillus porteri TaxID=2126350 RepID=A0ABX5FPN8_9BACL|nr:MBL fold metallo-hydrolase [Brevibacillus porteri]MED1800177.1 MBL fold metallo-hydrolase [Brevibacillus porteri]MED2131794.1 MBL fold metallo-hydrolase [Brevibacillus porteri]MED2748041.1 MBL fold metallo-hydrolase [Brevibacillus porteri]MED2812313.1 MBL fold metallo-hydrolase [Brevibacillus porteri]MED2896438.1 MBL fold metallo-hydrolase [Brevibacillus porteri]